MVGSLAIVVVLAIIGGLALLQPNPAEAALGEVAEAARVATPVEVPDGSFIYTRSERVDLAIRPGIEFGLERAFVAYLLPSLREVWRQPATSFIQIRTSNQEPTFFDPVVEAAYYRLGLDGIDRLNETQTERFTNAADPLREFDWPTESRPLHDALADYAAQGGDERPQFAQVFDLAIHLLREADPPRELRAGILQVVARLPVELIERTSRTITVGITYTTPEPTRHIVTLSLEGELLAETSTLLQADAELGIPADTETLRVIYLETRTTDDL
jgi:hypothetical protein